MNLIEITLSFSLLQKIQLGYIVLMITICCWSAWKLQAKASLHDNLALLAKPTFYVVISNIFFSLVAITFIYDPYVKSIAFNTLWFMPIGMFMICWFYSTKIYIQTVFRVPRHRRKQYQNIPRLFLVVFVLILFANVSRLISGITKLNSSLALFNSLAVLIIFGYIHHLLSKEIKNNSSKMSKARIKLFQYSVRTQFVGMLLFTISAALYSQGASSSSIIPYAVLGIGSAGIIIAFLSIWTVEIPKFIRVQFDLAPKRYEVIQAIQGIE